ncbi:MAG: hypothetical protein ACK4S2_10955 [Gemmobacter sp.]|uniref:hypothetical protein n=1 Tax=Gemmobacter sp. TaxID=1898957 RepID=UPI00391BD049
MEFGYCGPTPFRVTNLLRFHGQMSFAKGHLAMLPSTIPIARRAAVVGVQAFLRTDGSHARAGIPATISASFTTPRDGITARRPLRRAICETTSAPFQVTMQAGSLSLSHLIASSSFLRNPQSRLVPLALDGPIWNRSIGIARRC